MNSENLTGKVILVASVLSGIPITANARVIDHHWYIGMGAGMMQTNLNQGAMTVPNGLNYPPPENVDRYSLNQLQPIMLDIQVGQRWNRDESWIPSYVLALRYEHIFTKNITGMVTQYSDPEFTNYSYTWGISADVISLYSKLDLARYNRFMVYVDLGLGMSFSQTHAYNETELPNVIARDSPDYASKINYQLTYNIGVGIDYTLTKNLLLSAGYSYQSFGNLSSGFGRGLNWGNARLSLGKLNANTVLIGISYLV